MHSDEFVKDIKRFERKIRRPRSIFDVISSIRFFSKPHQAITKAQKLLFENAKKRALDYIFLFGLELGTDFPASPQAKNKIWREQIRPMLEKAREMACKEKDADKPTTDVALPGKAIMTTESKKVKITTVNSDPHVNPPGVSSHHFKQKQYRHDDKLRDGEADNTGKTRKSAVLAPQYFTVLPDWIIKAVSRRTAFEMLPKSVVDFAIDHRDIFGRWLQIPADASFSERPYISRNLYLVLCELNNHTFYKVGITKHKDPIRRDPNVYKRVICCHEVDNSWAQIYEQYCLWRCKQVRGKQPWDPIEFGWWAGKSEMIRSTDQAVESLFNEAYNEINKASGKLEARQVLFEWYLLDNLIKAIYDERYTSSALTAYAIAQKVVNHFSESHGDPDECLKVELHPIASKYLAKRLIGQLAPTVDRKWDQNNIRDPLKRYHMGKRLYEEWCFETWGDQCWSKAKPYRHMITYNLQDDSVKTELARSYRSNMYKVFISELPARKSPEGLAALKDPILPIVQKKEEPQCTIAYPDKLTVIYQDHHGDVTTRQISILSETLHSLDAYCHLRQEKRKFNIWNINSVLQDNGQQCWGPKYFHDLRLSSHLDMRRHLHLDIELYEEAAKIASKVVTRKQLAALEVRSLKAEAKFLEAKTEAAQNKAHTKWQVLQEACSIASEKKYDAQYRPCLVSRDSLFLTLFQLSYAYNTVSIDQYRHLRQRHPQLSDKNDWETYKGGDAPTSDAKNLQALKYLIEFRSIIESRTGSVETIEAIDSLAYSQPDVSNNYFNLRGTKRPSEQWLRLVTTTL